MDHVEYYFDSDEKKVKSIILDNIQHAIEKQAELDGFYPKDYASTLSFVCFNKKTNEVLTFSLGDSRIYRIRDDEVEHINQTVAHDHNRVCSTVSFGAQREAVLESFIMTEGDRFLLCTDGMWKMAEAEGLLVLLCSSCDGGVLVDRLMQCKIKDDCSFLLAA